MSNFSEKALTERIIELRKKHYGGRGRSEFAAKLGISPSTYFYYEQDRIPPIEILLKICELCDVGIYWLLTGEDDQNQPAHSPYEGVFGDILEKIKKAASENPASLQAVNAFIELIAQQNAIEAELSFADRQAENANVNGRIPVLGRTAAGTPGMWSQTSLTDPAITETRLSALAARHLHSPILKKHSVRISPDLPSKPIVSAIDNEPVSLIQAAGDGSDDIFQFIDCPAVLRAYPDCFALQIDGDSMAPRISDGDIVILSPSVGAVQGQPAVVQITGAIGVTCKLFRQDSDNIHLVPINEKYPPKVIKSDDILWSLAVLCHIKLKNIDS
ncbi:MAG: LexA family transcriptional regulator [Phycisphaerae bacterium]|nr:LexA family transcriptional regulator [Phycisphaerae bacterium]